MKKGRFFVRGQVTHGLLVIAILVFVEPRALAQTSQETFLFDALRAEDSAFFELGFNQCQLDYLEAHIADDLRFYHDQSGFQDRESFLRNTRENICADQAHKPIRKLRESSLMAFPMYSNGQLYGAIQTGEHDFYIRESGRSDRWTSSARFVHFWKRNGEAWILSQVLSYDHSNQPGDNSSELENLLNDNHVPAMGMGIIENGVLAKVEVYGKLDSVRPVSLQSLFKVASLTKPVFACLVLKLIDSGVMGLDEPLYPYWVDPEIQDDERYKLLTPRLILSHQSGFPNWRYLTTEGKLHFEFTPGAQYQYSGEGFEYLRKALENKTGQTMEELAQIHLFNPLGMSDTHFWWDEDVSESRYARNFDEEGHLLPLQKYDEGNAAANLITTVQDYGVFMSHVLAGAGLSDSLYAEMISIQATLGASDYFGLGWEMLTDLPHGEIALLHSGRDQGVSTLAVLYPHTQKGFLLFFNGGNPLSVYEYLLNNRLYLGTEIWNRR